MNFIKKALIFMLPLLLLCGCGCGRENKTPPVAETVRISFPEGSTILEISRLLEENGVCPASEFRELCRSLPEGREELFGTAGNAGNSGGTTGDSSAAKASDGGKQGKGGNVGNSGGNTGNSSADLGARQRLFGSEGYLFPDTYEFYKGENAKSVLNRFLDNMQNKLSPSLKERAERSRLSIDELLTLASIVQSEAGEPEEMKRVSAVFLNRLELSRSGFPYLGSDATRHYIEKSKAYIDEEELDFDALFREYCTNDGYELKSSGLPAGPICNPGLDAIEAVLSPEDSSYLYFFTDRDGAYHYSSSLSEHQRCYARCYG